MPAAGCSGRSVPTTGAGGCRRSTPSRIAAAIAAFEPVRWVCQRGSSHARPAAAQCGSSMSRTMPGCATSARPSSSTPGAAARRRLAVQCLGRTGGRCIPGDDDAVARKVLRDRRPRPLPRAVRHRRRRHPRRRPRHAAGHRTVPAEPQPQSAPAAREIEQLLERYSASNVIWLGEGVIATRPPATSTTSAFARPGEVCLTWTDDRRDPQYACRAMRTSG